VRTPTARRALLVFDRVRPLAVDVLYQRPAARHVPNLYPEADGEERQLPGLDLSQHERVGLVPERVHLAETLVRLLPES
jgi:hypothetical protein